ncbi:uncharacterized protein LOC123987798 [Osmia bicornis bicornis]|uniref:uncharacterized protein LOC123987798 n=1 Tax=Osmia bicornis bicornis TaxID=1437191 RepID=UPI001EAF8C2F|nr:uncharacterized protein LOC123987798 [Osmia bicornis bicornis]
MSDIESLLKQQQDAMYFVHRSLENFKKIGKSNYTIASARNRIAKLEDAFKESQRLHRQIVAVATTEHQRKLEYFSEKQFLKAHEAYLATSDYMAEVLNQLEEMQKPSVPSGSTSDSDPKTSPPVGVSNSEGLPKLHLPTASGDLEEWESFRDRFHAMIVGNKHLPQVSKLQYLLSCVTREPLDMMPNIAITDANFQIAWDLLTRRYENKRRLITAHVQSLLNLPRAVTESQTALSEVRARANMGIQALRNLGCAVDSWDAILVCLIVNCLDKHTRRAWELQLGNSTEFQNVNELDNFLETRIRSLESIAISKTATITQQSGSSNQKATHPRSAAPSHATTSYTPRCPLCQASHGLNQCPAFRAKPVAQRFEYVKQGKRCINCFSSQHGQRDCKSHFSCQKCHKRHHTLLHFTNTASSSAIEASPAKEDSPSNQSNIDSQTSVATLSVMTSTAIISRVLLATAWVEVHTTAGRVQRVRALLDQGSVVSLITENLAQRLKAPRAHVSITITGVGNSDISCKTSTTLQIVSCKRSRPAYSTTALIVTNLSNYLPPRVSGNFNLQHLRGLDLADDNPFSSDPIEMIVGADIYGLILQQGLKKGAANEPVAQDTTLGWILSGPIPTNSDSQTLPFQIAAQHCTTLEDLDSALRGFWEIE